ncbi:RDD family protein [Fulvivirgaceae bacterium PWU4]|uniref:RDD family protein n=1 Tax=Chryseosolibacter histidini TaxID=2782349 RepID=A0AAP2DLR5_9BACT|nr:RDD family protein [Chryseosolibacter histidini]MBT1698703.1 RDD family protein [Chryseosolibacter histidini]
MENTDQILDAPTVESTRLQYAGFGIRFGAYIIDFVLLFVVNFVIGLALAQVPLLGSLISLVIGVCYFGYMESSDGQATLGKMAVGIKVGDENGGPITFMNALGRYLGKIVSALLLCIGFLMVAWDEKKQGLHDKMAGTYVFHAK